MAVEALEFPEIADLINRSKIAKINKVPQDKRDGWELYGGEYKAHVTTQPFEVLYIPTRTTTEAIIDARKRVFKEGRTQVVYAPSLDKKINAHRQYLQPGSLTFWNSREYLASFISDELDAYRHKLMQFDPKFYVEPSIEVPLGTSHKVPNPILLMLSDRDPSDAAGKGLLGALLAQPGQGKTYMSQYLVHELARGNTTNKNLFPIYISAEQWHSMAQESLTSIWKTIGHSFRYFEVPIGWIDGYEEQFFRTSLKAGLFAIVFDGFDEYILQNKGRISPLDVLKNLLSIVDQTGARILVTTRTTFWNSEVADFVLNIPGANDYLKAYALEPFDVNHARSYFTKRFEKQAGNKINKAVEVFSQLRQASADFAGRGFVLNLVADLIERGFETTSINTGDRPVAWLVSALCEREQLRQNLPINATEQIATFQHFISEMLQGSEPDDDLLDYALAISASNLDAKTRAECISKLSSHPIVTRDKPNSWRIPQQQVEINLLARFLIENANPAEEGLPLKSFARKARLGDAYIVDLAEMIVAICERQENSEVVIAEVIKAFLKTQEHDKFGLPDSSVLGKLAVQVALQHVDTVLPKGSTHKLRTQALISVLPGKQLKGITFIGSIARFDLSAATFDHCRFENVRWANCKFDDGSKFLKCHFIGGSIQSSGEIGLAQFADISTDSEARTLLQSMQINAGRRNYNSDDLREDIRSVVTKFIAKGGVVIKDVRKMHIDSGHISLSKHKNEVLEELGKSIYIEKSGSGGSEGRFEVRDSALDAIKFFATNNVFTGVLQEAFDRIRKKLKL